MRINIRSNLGEILPYFKRDFFPLIGTSEQKFLEKKVIPNELGIIASQGSVPVQMVDDFHDFGTLSQFLLQNFFPAVEAQLITLANKIKSCNKKGGIHVGVNCGHRVRIWRQNIYEPRF